MPNDANLILAASATVTGTTNGSALKFPGGTTRRGMKARVIYSAALVTSSPGTDTIAFSIDVCYDGVPTLWYSEFYPPAIITLTATAQVGEVFIPFEIFPTSVANGTQIRLTATFSSTAHGNTITYQGDITATHP